jgi:DNA-binding NtrC family response regulator
MVKAGASDYLAKPWDDVKLVAAVKHLLATRNLAAVDTTSWASGAAASGAPRTAANDVLRPPSPPTDLAGLVVTSAALQRVVSLALQVAGADVPVLITGPNGVGKEKIAEIVHANSPRRSGPFIKVNVGALPDSLLESELFGAEAGAYTGLTRRRSGRFEAADGGTLFLDEIGNLSEAGQMKLLRVLQSGEFERLGSSQTQRVDVRILAATNADLPNVIASGRFREDLFFRLNVIEIQLPALKDRPDDILALAEHFLKQQPTRGRTDPWRLAASASAALLEHSWPGNVRELANRIQRATLVANASLLEAEDFDLPARCDSSRDSNRPAVNEPGAALERAELERALRDADGKVTLAAERLGMSRQALYRRMERLGIVLERRPKL